jgi:imidazolonepropionase
MNGDLVVAGFGSLVTNVPTGGDPLGRVEGAVVAVRDGLVAWTGPEDDLPSAFRAVPIVVHPGGAAVPGFVDAHTHVVFAGDRADEFAMRMEGAGYEEILAAGGGIHRTVAATRAATDDELYEASSSRVRRMLATGTTTLEVKSGYGLDVATEARMLRVARRLGEDLPVDVVPTFLGAHVVPGEFRDDRDAYLELVTGEMLSACAPLAEACDVFCDEGAFTVDEARSVLEAGRRAGLRPRLHADQLAGTGAAELAAEVGAVSADHLDHASDAGLAALAAAGTAAVLLPGVSFSLRLPAPPARRIAAAGVHIAIATDCNPGSSYVETMPFVIALAVVEAGLTPDEALWAATRGGALALDRPRAGRLAPGDPADFVVLDAGSHVDLAYRPDGDLVSAVYKRGERVA